MWCDGFTIPQDLAVPGGVVPGVAHPPVPGPRKKQAKCHDLPLRAGNSHAIKVPERRKTSEGRLQATPKEEENPERSEQTSSTPPL